MNLILEMLLLLEDMPVPVGSGVLLKRGAEEIAVPGYGLDQIKFHFSLLRNAGFIDVVTIEPTTGLRFKGLTWAGHDFLDRARQREASDNWTPPPRWTRTSCRCRLTARNAEPERRRAPRRKGSIHANPCDTGPERRTARRFGPVRASPAFSC